MYFLKVRLIVIIFAIVNILLFLNFFKNREDKLVLSDYIDKDRFSTNHSPDFIINPNNEIYQMSVVSELPLLFREYIVEALNNNGDFNIASNIIKDRYSNLNWDNLKVNSSPPLGVALLLPYELDTGFAFVPNGDVFTNGGGFKQVLILEAVRGCVEVRDDAVVLLFSTIAHEYMHSVLFNPVLSFVFQSKINKIIDISNGRLLVDINENLACLFEVYATSRFYKIPIERALQNYKNNTSNILSATFWKILYRHFSEVKVSSLSDVFGVISYGWKMLSYPYLSKHEIKLLYPLYIKIMGKELDMIYSNLEEYIYQDILTEACLDSMSKNLNIKLNSIEIAYRIN